MMKNVFKIPSFTNSVIKGKIVLPEKLKGTIIEKWTNYWKNLFIDYRQMMQDLRSDIQEEPRKAFYWSIGILSAYNFYRYNPNDIDFKDQLKKIANEISLVNEDIRNPKAIEHVRFLEKSYNEGVIHYQSFGLLSLIYVSELNDACNLYKTQCSYLKPSYFTQMSKVVDIGVMGRWWNIYIKTNNFDVNF